MRYKGEVTADGVTVSPTFRTWTDKHKPDVIELDKKQIKEYMSLINDVMKPMVAKNPLYHGIPIREYKKKRRVRAESLDEQTPEIEEAQNRPTFLKRVIRKVRYET